MRYICLFLIISLMAIPAFAQDPTATPAPTPTPEPTASPSPTPSPTPSPKGEDEIFKSKYTSMLKDKISGMGLDVNKFTDTVDEKAKQCKKKADEFNAEYKGQSDRFFNKAVTEINNILSDWNANKDKPGFDKVKGNYEDMLHTFIGGYMDDMIALGVNETPTFTWDGDEANGNPGYKKDFENLTEWFQEDLALMQAMNEQSSVGLGGFRPEDKLDHAADELQASAIKFEFGWGGVSSGHGSMYGNKKLDQSLKSMMSTLIGYGAGPALNKQKDWFSKSWSSYENVVMEDNDNEGKQGKKYAQKVKIQENTQYIVNQYGEIVPNNADTQHSYGDSIIPDSGSCFTVTQKFNNRSYGYRYGSYANFTKEVAKITVGKKSYKLKHHVYTSPIVLDMDGDGKIQASNGKYLPHRYEKGKMVEFDINGDGFLDLIEWVGPNDGLLVHNYKMGEEINGHNLFGETGGWANGFEKMMAFDKNKDEILSGDEIKGFQVWMDKNGNAVVDKGELTSLESNGITALAINPAKMVTDTKQHKPMSSFFKQNGKTKIFWDWYPFVIEVKRGK